MLQFFCGVFPAKPKRVVFFFLATGVLVPLRDAVALANAIQELLRDPVRCATMGQAGRELAESAFDVRQVVAVHLQIYQELMDKS